MVQLRWFTRAFPVLAASAFSLTLISCAPAPRALSPSEQEFNLRLSAKQTMLDARDRARQAEAMQIQGTDLQNRAAAMKEESEAQHRQGQFLRAQGDRVEANHWFVSAATLRSEADAMSAKGTQLIEKGKKLDDEAESLRKKGVSLETKLDNKDHPAQLPVARTVD